MIPREHQNFIDNSISFFKRDPRVVGLAAAGSYITNEMDEFSDVDLVIAVKPEYYEEVQKERKKIAGQLGNLLSAFTGEHVGEPRLIICLYADPLLHVDLKFVSINDMAHRVEEYKILWEKDGLITEKFKEEEAIFPTPSLQWIEDRFWTWIHYGAVKLGRGEIFEVIEFISYLRQNVVGPLILMHKGKQPRGVRKIEYDAPEYLERLKSTVPLYDKTSCIEAIRVMIELYRELREIHRFSGFVYKSAAESFAVDYLAYIEQK